MIKIDVNIQITDNNSWFDEDRDKIIGISEIFNNELMFFPECLDEVLKKIKFQLNSHIRNEADRDFAHE